jgi:hypothetical protein
MKPNSGPTGLWAPHRRASTLAADQPTLLTPVNVIKAKTYLPGWAAGTQFVRTAFFGR